MKGNNISALILVGAVIAGGMTMHAVAADPLTDEPVVRGEVARLLRQAYDYEHRNSNRNVFRRSKHFSPTGNVFRSSQYYQRRLAASSDGYPVRSTTTFGRSVNGGKPDVIEYSQAHHRRSPFGLPSIEERGLEALVLGDGNRTVGRAGVDNYYTIDHSDGCTESRESSPQHDENSNSNRDVLESIIAVRPTLPAEMETTILPDGSTKIVIRNVAAARTDAVQDTSIDAAWMQLNSGDTAGAADNFAKQTIDIQRGAEALLGFGIAKLLAGEIEESARALRRAERIDEHIYARLLLELPLRERLQSVRLKQSESMANPQSDETTINRALDQLLD